MRNMGNSNILASNNIDNVIITVLTYIIVNYNVHIIIWISSSDSPHTLRYVLNICLGKAYLAHRLFGLHIITTYMPHLKCSLLNLIYTLYIVYANCCKQFLIPKASIPFFAIHDNPSKFATLIIRNTTCTCIVHMTQLLLY